MNVLFLFFPACLPAYLLAYLSVYLLAYLSVYLPICACFLACLPDYSFSGYAMCVEFIFSA